MRFAPQLARGLFPMAPAEGLVLMDSGFDRFPKMSIATDDKRAAALASPPKFVIMGEDDAAASRAFFEASILDQVVYLCGVRVWGGACVGWCTCVGLKYVKYVELVNLLTSQYQKCNF